MQIIYIGKCEDGSFYHIIVTRFGIHVYKRFHNGKRWITQRILAGVENVLKNLKKMPARLRSCILEILRSHPMARPLLELKMLRARLAESQNLKNGARRHRDLIRLTVHVLDLCKRLLNYLDYLPEKVREKARKIALREYQNIVDLVDRLDVPEHVRHRIRNVTSVWDIVDAVELTLMEHANAMLRSGSQDGDM